jgi:SAM-dependent methyltransferase
MPDTREDNYRRNLALVFHRGLRLHALASAPGILALLEPVRPRGGLVLELGCGTGTLTEQLTAAGHRVIATDASPAMLELAGDYAPDALAIRQLTLPDDPLPPADAVVSVGHVLNYLPDEAAIDQTLIAIARAVRPGGLFAVDLIDISYGTVLHENSGRAGRDWAIITQYRTPSPDLVIRDLTTFVPQADGSWRRDDECHRHVLIDAQRVPGLLAPEGIEVTVARAFGDEPLPPGLAVLIGRRPAA